MGYELLPADIIPHEPLNDSYAVTLPNPYLRSDYENRLARQVKRHRRSFTKYAITWPLTPAQFKILCGWLENAAGGLGGWFDLNVFRDDEYERMSVRFVMPLPPVRREGGEWMWSGDIETMSYQPIDDVATAAAMLTYGTDESLEDLVDRLYDIVHHDYPEAVG